MARSVVGSVWMRSIRRVGWWALGTAARLHIAIHPYAYTRIYMRRRACTPSRRRGRFCLPDAQPA